MVLSTAPDPVAIITTASADLSTDLVGVATVGLGIGVLIFALRKGWSLLKRFTS